MKHPSVSSEAADELLIKENLRNDIVAHCRSQAPIEACGLLSGREQQVKTVHQMTNTDAEAEHYMMDPQEQFEVFKELRDSENEIIAIYHSHPASQAYPSPEDVRLAFYPGVIYVIVSLAEETPVIRGFKIINDQIEEIAITTG